MQAPVTLHDWDNQKKSRFINSPITYQTNLYLELQRKCNMKCTFCRNSGLDTQKYHYNNIIENLRAIYSHLNNIVIGGGEPTLLLQDLKALKSDLGEKNSRKFQVITNGSLSVEDYSELRDDYVLYISRHAIDDKENRDVFGDQGNIVLSANDLSKIADKNYVNRDVLCCTCFKGGVDSKDKMIDYIKFAQELGYSNILFQTLHQEENFENSFTDDVETIDEIVIPNVLGYLDRLGFHISQPIYSTSGYELHLASNSKMNMNISFKEYKNPKLIEQKWNQSTKRCFDLSMAPNGDVYETWDQQQKPIKIKKR